MFTYEDNKVELRNQSNPLRLAATISDTRTLLSCPTPSIPASPAVNFINVKRTNFLYERCFSTYMQRGQE